jgi:tRNA (cytidine/uridine-2'-O-)-methyltransferase
VSDVRKPAPAPRPDRDLHVVLVHPEIHGNTGSSGRTCLAAGAQLHLVKPLGFSLDDARVRRAGLDYWPRVQPRVWPDWPSFAAEIPSLGEPYFFSSDAEIDFWDASFVGPTVLVFGRESVGLPAEIREQYARRMLRLPMCDARLRSINLANSVAVALYEVLRQRRVAGR